MGISGSKSSGKQPKFKNLVSWFEIPVLNFDKAVSFYTRIFEIELKVLQSNGYSMAFFPSEGGASGAIMCGEGYYPSDGGVLVYLNGGGDLSDILIKIPESGGRIIVDKTKIDDESGYFALFLDTEGNKLGLHSKQ